MQGAEATRDNTVFMNLLLVGGAVLLGAFRLLARAQIARNLESSYATFPALKERRRQLAATLRDSCQR